MMSNNESITTLSASDHRDSDDIVNGMVDYSGWPAKRTQTGFWRSAYFIIAVGAAERFAYYGIASNLITYLTGPLGQPTASAAASINLWTGIGLLLPLFGAFVADSFLGRFRTIVCSSLLYILALALLTTSALFNQEGGSSINSISPNQLHLLFFFVSLYLIALGQGMYKPCIVAFGADQFNEQDPQELCARSSYFNWWFFSIFAGPLAALVVLNYIQDNVSWAIGFGIPCIAMAGSLTIFMLGTKKYRYNIKTTEKCAISRVSHVFLKAAKNYRVIQSSSASEERNDKVPQLYTQQFKFLNKALLAPDDSTEYGETCSLREVEEAKAFLTLIPLWATSLPFGIASAQPLTLFTEQGITLDRSITPCFKIPAASLSYIIGISIIFLVPVYDRLIVPLSRLITRTPTGITKLQRIGTGMLICTLCMVTAALIEKKRLDIASVHVFAYNASITLPMSFLWIIPQYILYGLFQVFTLVGLQEIFYEQVPYDLKSVGLSLCMSIYGIGNLLSSFLICMIEGLTTEGGGTGWFSDNTNQAHLDYFYWLLAGLNAVGFFGFLCIARSFKCKNNAGNVG